MAAISVTADDRIHARVLYSWGCAEHGQLGRGKVCFSEVPNL